MAKSTSSFFLDLVIWNLMISLDLKVLKNFMHSFFLGGIPVCVSTICQHGQISVSCRIPSESFFLPNHAYSSIPYITAHYI